MIANSKLQHSVPGPYRGWGEEAIITLLWSRASYALLGTLNLGPQSTEHRDPQVAAVESPRSSHLKHHEQTTNKRCQPRTGIKERPVLFQLSEFIVDLSTSRTFYQTEVSNPLFDLLMTSGTSIRSNGSKLMMEVPRFEMISSLPFGHISR